jgi:hypothetical protein
MPKEKMPGGSPISKSESFINEELKQKITSINKRSHEGKGGTEESLEEHSKVIDELMRAINKKEYADEIEKRGYYNELNLKPDLEKHRVLIHQLITFFMDYKEMKLKQKWSKEDAEKRIEG